ncbi:uncharacterized protein LOC106160008 [Lingula anatina]|uniref:Uncharacterized protein LOC106160008 n=1 Tax=Lingula anatina TaxID=7574 RepID=A0A1S3I115_LINAN|nr:uncharacterized protein LOC106160008 [Lingula anatina]|eukprot:XP_013391953.1 uncharacterized protein LOC106160008 [Lingula anatina]
MKPYIIVPTAAALIILTAFSYYLYGADIKSLFLDNGKTIEGKADNGVFEKTSFLNIPQTVQLHMENNPIAMKPGLQEMPKQYSFTVVSGASSGFFSPGLKNLVGSVHHWSPGRNIVIWDLGLSEEQVAEIKTWCRVTYKKVPFRTLCAAFS